MDSEIEFESLADAARWLCKSSGIDEKSAPTLVANIHAVVDKQTKRGQPRMAYGHTWTTPKPDLRVACYEYGHRVSELEHLVRDMLPYLSDDIGAEGLKERVRALGLEG